MLDLYLSMNRKFIRQLLLRIDFGAQETGCFFDSTQIKASINPENFEELSETDYTSCLIRKKSPSRGKTERRCSSVRVFKARISQKNWQSLSTTTLPLEEQRNFCFSFMFLQGHLFLQESLFYSFWRAFWAGVGKGRNGTVPRKCVPVPRVL